MLSFEISWHLPGFSLDVAQSLPATGVTALFGQSGAGKSSVLRVIAGMEPQISARVRWGETVWQDAGHFTPPHKRGLGYVFQDTRLFDHLSVAGNLAYADRRARGLPGAGWDEVTQALGLTPLLDRSPATLSGGEASRVAIGRAVLTRPRMLLLDEPLAALDSARRAAILPYLERLRDRIGIPMLYVSHDMTEVARLADHMILLDAGRIAHAGPLAKLLSDPEIAPALGLREAGAVLTLRVAGQESDGLTRLDSAAGPILLPHIDAAPGASLRVRIMAQDVILARTAPAGLSALNILPVQVTAIRSGHGPGALVQLRLGQDLILARITRRSATALDLKPGCDCFAILKSVSVAPANIGADGLTGTNP